MVPLLHWHGSSIALPWFLYCIAMVPLLCRSEATTSDEEDVAIGDNEVGEMMDEDGIGE